jgi:hypothetical protein
MFNAADENFSVAIVTGEPILRPNRFLSSHNHQFGIKIRHAARPRRRGDRMSGKILSDDSAPR